MRRMLLGLVVRSASRQPSNQAAEENGSSPLPPATCFFGLFETWTSAFRAKRVLGVHPRGSLPSGTPK
jgi:hypothetical protein